MPENKFKIKLLNGLGSLFGLSQALLIYVVSSYFKQLSGKEDVGIFFFFAYLAVFIGLLNFHKLVKVFGKSIVLQLAILGEILLILILIFSNLAWLSIAALVAYLILDSLVGVGMDIILETFSHDRNSGRIRGYFITLMYVGFVLGPFFSTLLLGRYGFSGIFMVAAVLKSMMLAIVFWGFHRVNHDYNGRGTILEIFKKVKKHKNILRIYYISFALEFFYAMMVIYMPIYLRSLGISWQQIGYIFTVMIIPFLFFEYPIGWLADKKWGEKKMIIFFLSWMAATTSLVYFIKGSQVWVWMLVLLATRIGAASIQVLRDSYFYKRIDGEDVDLIDFYRTAASASYIVGAALSVIVLRIASIKELFILTVIVLLSALLPASRLKNNLCEADAKTPCP